MHPGYERLCFWYCVGVVSARIVNGQTRPLLQPYPVGQTPL